VRKKLKEALGQGPEPLRLAELREDGERRYTGEAISPHGTSYRLTVRTEGRSLVYEAEGGGRVLRGRTQKWSEPPWDERHPVAMQWVRGSALVLHVAGVVWPALGRLGLRRQYSQRTERILKVVAIVNLVFAVMWGYLFVMHWGAE